MDRIEVREQESGRDEVSWADAFSEAISTMMPEKADSVRVVVRVTMMVAAMVTIHHPEWWGPTAAQLVKEQEELRDLAAETNPDIATEMSDDKIKDLADHCAEVFKVGEMRSVDGIRNLFDSL